MEEKKNKKEKGKNHDTTLHLKYCGWCGAGASTAKKEEEIVAKTQTYPHIMISNCHFGLCLSVFLPFCTFVFLFFCLFVFSSRHSSDQMSEGSQVSKVTLCVKILKWRSVTDPVTKVKYRAARAAKKCVCIQLSGEDDCH